MFTALVATLLTPLIGGSLGLGSLGALGGWFGAAASHAGTAKQAIAVAKAIAKVVPKGKPLTQQQAAQLHRMREANGRPLTKQQWNRYVYEGVKTW